MKCLKCKNEIPDGSIYCNWCGVKQIRERGAKREITVPKPRQLSSGKWFIQMRLGGQSVSVPEGTEARCTAKARAIKAGFLETRKKPEDITLREACTKYIESKPARLSPTSIETYEKIRDQYFQGIMDKKLGALTPDVLDAAVEQECSRISRRGKRLSPKTIKSAWMFVACVLNKYAPDLDHSEVQLPELNQTVPLILPPEKIYHAVKGTDVELPCLLAMWLSLSMSEIRGLTKLKSVVNGKLIISETVVRVNNRDVRKKGGKEETRTRALDIPPYIQDLIDQVEGDVLVPQSGHAVYMRFTRLLKKHGLPHITFHRLRHINASVMSLLGIPDKDSQERGGWKTDHTMKQIYRHSFTAQRQLSDRKIDAFFGSIISGEDTVNAAQIANKIANKK